MKNHILTLTLILASATAMATPQSYTLGSLKELCALEDYEAEQDAFVELKSDDIAERQSLTAEELRMINLHLRDVEYTDKDLSAEEIISLFRGEGELAYNDLYIITFQARKSGRIYVQVKTWPGDNPYGLIFDAQTGRTVAHNGDSSITLLTNAGPYSCWSLSK